MSIVSIEAQNATSECKIPLPRRHAHLLGMAVGSRLHTSLTLLVELVALVRGIVHRLLAGMDLLDGGEDARPVLEDGEGDVFAGAVGDEICMIVSQG